MHVLNTWVAFRGFPTRMVYLYHIWCLRYTILVGNPRIFFCQLRKVGNIRSYLSTDSANKRVVSLILSKSHCCNSLLAGLPDIKLNKRQCIQNPTAWRVLRKPRHASAASLLITLHWLPAKAWIHYKITCLCFQCLYQNSMQPYVSDLLSPRCPSGTLRFLDASTLTVPSFTLEIFGKRKEEEDKFRKETEDSSL